MSKAKYRIPFRKEKSGEGLVHWVMLEWSALNDPHVNTIDVNDRQYGYRYDPDEWRDNVTFDAVLQLVDWYKGRSAARFRVINEANHEHYSMAISASFDAIKAFGVAGGLISGKWTFRKQGANYSLVPVLV